LFHLYSPFAKASDGGAVLDESALAYEFFISEFSGCFFDFLPLILLLVLKPPSRNNHRRATYPRTQQHVRRG